MCHYTSKCKFCDKRGFIEYIKKSHVPYTDSDEFQTIATFECRNIEIVSFLYKANLPIRDPKDVQQAKSLRRSTPKLTASRNDLSNSNTRDNNAKVKPKPQPIRTEKKVGRNEPCPCGSGKKYKQCHG